MYVIGTAGHVDHGKSTLVQALTGIDPDRLAEEKAREMTIDLGFAWLHYLAGEATAAGFASQPLEIGMIDVPGHRDFIENMLAGVGGIDLALLVIAADEGIMPQTREHLAILDLLAVSTGLVAVTKQDMVDDPDWLDLIHLDISDIVAGTVLANAPMINVSSRTGQGIADLRLAILRQLRQARPRLDLGRPRLAVDRVFSLSGFGTVVTGTLTDGRFQVGDPVEIQPGGLKARIRGLQTHKQKLATAQPGSRVAVNLTGISTEEIVRGDVLTSPGQLQPTLLLDAGYRHLSDADKPLRHNTTVKLFTGAAERMARVRLLGARQINPGDAGWLQLVLTEPVAISRGDRFILRRPSPGQTIGGGQILDPHPGRRYRRFRPEVIQRMVTMSQGSPADLLIQTIQQHEPVTLNQLKKQVGLDYERLPNALHELLTNGRVIQVGEQLFTYPGWQRYRDHLLALLTHFEVTFPLRAGMSREAARSQLKLPAAAFNPLVTQLASAGKLVENGALLHTPGHVIRFTDEQERAIQQLMAQFEQSGVNSPSVKEARTVVGDGVYYALVDLGKLVPISADVIYSQSDYAQISRQIQAQMKASGRTTTAEIRDLLQTSRKYAIAFLEHLDDLKITRRIGDDRVLVKRDG